MSMGMVYCCLFCSIFLSFILLLFYLTERCSHKYKIVKTHDVYEDNIGELPIATQYVCECTKCGRLKFYKI